MIGMALALAMTLTACGGNAAGGDDTADTTAVSEETVAFDADSAYALVERQCDFGPRVPGTDAHEACAAWLAATLRARCDTVVEQRGTVTTFDGVTLHITNLVGSFNPEASERVLLLAHWDCRPWADADPDESQRREPVMGANDAASGVGVLLELARVWQLARPRQGIDILLVDAEDWGEEGGDEDSWALGTQYWAAHPHVDGYTARYGVLLDMVGARGAKFRREQFSTYYAGDVQDRVWRAAAAEGLASTFLNEPGGAVTDDHIAVNRRGIPCIDIIDTRPTPTGFFDGWHTTHDTMDQIDRATLRAVGQTLLRALSHEQ